MMVKDGKYWLMMVNNGWRWSVMVNDACKSMSFVDLSLHPPRIIDADTHQDEGQNLLQHCEGDTKQHREAVARHAPEDHQVELRHAYHGNPSGNDCEPSYWPR